MVKAADAVPSSATDPIVASSPVVVNASGSVQLKLAASTRLAEVVNVTVIAAALGLRSCQITRDGGEREIACSA